MKRILFVIHPVLFMNLYIGNIYEQPIKQENSQPVTIEPVAIGMMPTNPIPVEVIEVDSTVGRDTLVDPTTKTLSLRQQGLYVQQIPRQIPIGTEALFCECIVTSVDPMTAFLLEPQFFLTAGRSMSCGESLLFELYLSDYYGQLDVSTEPIASVFKSVIVDV